MSGKLGLGQRVLVRLPPGYAQGKITGRAEIDDGVWVYDVQLKGSFKLWYVPASSVLEDTLDHVSHETQGLRA